MQNCFRDPPQDVCHVQFKSRAAWYLVWVPPTFETFVVVDDEGEGLNVGRPTGDLPPVEERARNFRHVDKSKYGAFANKQAIISNKGVVASFSSQAMSGKNSSSSGGGSSEL